MKMPARLFGGCYPCSHFYYLGMCELVLGEGLCSQSSGLVYSESEGIPHLLLAFFSMPFWLDCFLPLAVVFVDVVVLTEA